MSDSYAVALPVFPQLDGVFVLNKPAGPTSAQCLKLFKRMGQKKIGHAGTLDPMATGVLIILLGQATKISAWLLAGGKKTYAGSLRLGVETDTWDMTGKVLKTSPHDAISREQIAEEIAEWRNIAEQVVPPYSAAKHQGQPLYKLARCGKTVPQKVKKIKVLEARMLDCNMPVVNFRVECSSGSYIRSLAHSLGKRLGCGAALENLTREYSYPFELSQAVSLEQIRETPALLVERLLPIGAALPDWPEIELNMKQLKDVRNGKSLPVDAGVSNGRALLCYNGCAVALAQAAVGMAGPEWKISRGLWN